jgi:hypothetical protein
VPGAARTLTRARARFGSGALLVEEVLRVATLDAPTAQQSRLLVLFPLFVLLWGNEKKLASERAR